MHCRVKVHHLVPGVGFAVIGLLTISESGVLAAAVAKRPVSSDYAHVPLAFESNEGQADPTVKFLSRGSGYTLSLTQTEAVLSSHPAKDGDPAVVRMQFAGASMHAAIRGLDEQPGRSNYFIGTQRQWLRG